MLTLFANVFGRARTDPSRLPELLVKQLTERALDGTDPRMRMMSGYAKTLRKPVLHAARHVIDLVARLPPPLLLAPGSLRESPLLSAFLYSETEAGRILARDSALLEYRAAHQATTPTITALLVVERGEKRGFGYAQVGDQTLADVPKTTVSFSRHRLLEPAGDEADTRRGLKRRAFDLLLALALTRITDHSEARKELAGHRALLRSKLDILKRSGNFASHTAAGERESLQARLTAIEERLSALGPCADVLRDNLAIVADVLADAGQHLGLRETTLHLDKFYVLHDKPEPSVPGIVCRDLYNSEGRQATLQMVQLPSA